MLWAQGLADLRGLCLTAGLTETVKWGHPCYMHAGRNVVIMGAFRGDFRLTFFNAGLMDDPDSVMERQGPNTRHPDMIRFTDTAGPTAMEPVIRAYLHEAIGQINTAVAGATGLLTYNWNVDSLDGLDTLRNLLAGTYILTVIDEAGCSATDTVVLSTLPSMTLTMTVLQPASGPGAYDGSASIAFGNGLAPYTLFIIPAVGDTVSYTILSDTAGIDTLRNLPADYYYVLLSDANDCSISGGFVLCGNLVSSITSTDVSCNGQADGTAIVSITGAYPPVSFQWSNQVQNINTQEELTEQIVRKMPVIKDVCG